MSEAATATDWQELCSIGDLIPGAGVCAYFDGQAVALFYLPDLTPSVYAVSDWDPIGGASVISRGIVCDLRGHLVVASPLYKQHFDLTSGQCLEQDDVALKSYAARLDGERVLLASLA